MKRQIGIAMAIVLAISLMLPGAAFADNGCPSCPDPECDSNCPSDNEGLCAVEITGSLDTGLAGIVNLSTQSTDAYTEDYQLNETQSFAEVYGPIGPLANRAVVLTEATVYKDENEYWVGDSMEKSQYYKDDVFTEQETIIAGPGIGENLMHKEIDAACDLRKDKTTMFVSTGGTLAETFQVVNCGDVSAGVGFAGEYLMVDEFTTVHTTEDGITNTPATEGEPEGCIATFDETLDTPPTYGVFLPILQAVASLTDQMGILGPLACEALGDAASGMHPAYGCDWNWGTEGEPGTMGHQDIMFFDHQASLTGEQSIGLSVLANGDTQTMTVTDQQSHLGTDFTITKMYSVNDCDPPCEYGDEEVPPCPVPPVP